MALESEDSQVGLVELEELEAIEIDEALLRELLEADVEECNLEESVQKNDNKTMDKKLQDQNQLKQKITCSSDQQHEGCNIEFEWMNNDNNNNNNMMTMMMEMEATLQNEQVIMNNWHPDDDMVGMMVDFGCTNDAQFGSQVCEGLICYEASYGCLWDDL